MKIFYVLSLFAIRYSLFAIPVIAFSQCPTTPIILSSQADVNAFTTNYPNCTQLLNTLTISGADIVDLTPLSGITSVRSLSILDNTQLENLEGLNTITHIDGYDEENYDPLDNKE